ncbi:MAG: Fe-S cluster assembly ATPase SufC [Bradymonadales bacterium]|nr:MAG: Fe-S cluster assembly ATPase SufC [Bradymonadales bacterium]
MSMRLEIEDLVVSVEGKKILQGLNLQVRPGELHALMGRNGSGKSTLAYCLMGHPRYKVESGRILLDGEEIQELSPEERSKRGLFLGFQHPVEIPGVTVANFLRASLRSLRPEIPPKDLRAMMKREAGHLQVPDSFFTRFVNEGFSGGEKKRLETLQLRLIQPKLAVLDETDSGLDIDALRTISESIAELRDQDKSFLLITHYQRILNYLKPDRVHVLYNGKILRSGGMELAEELEKKGYDEVIERGQAA